MDALTNAGTGRSERLTTMPERGRGWRSATSSRPRGGSFFWPQTMRQVASICLMAAVILVLSLSLLMAPRRTGDAHQYLVMAMQLAQLRPPSLAPSEEEAYRDWFTAQPGAYGFPDGARALRQPALIAKERQEFSHFWFYPLLATPTLKITEVLGGHPLAAFAVTNALLLAAALWVAARAFNPLAALLVLASPLPWFVGRAQVEVFTLSMLTLVMAAAARRRWGWVGIALAVAATQNAPIALALPLVWAAAGIDWCIDRRRSGLPLTPERAVAVRVTLFAMAALGIAMLHPAYYLWRLGVLTPQQLNGGIAQELPSLARYLAPILDPDIGFLFWLPLTAILAIAGTVRAVRSQRDVQSLLPLALGLAIGIWFLFVFAQTTNVNSGGTVHVSRYVLWLIPLLLPALDAATRPLLTWVPAPALLTACCALALYLVVFWPDQPERYVEHSPQATWLMTHALDFYRPLPEVFVERTLHVDGGPGASAADPGCRLVLVVAAAPEQPCALTKEEQFTAGEQFTRKATAVWIRRGENGTSAVQTAIRRQ